MLLSQPFRLQVIHPLRLARRSSVCPSLPSPTPFVDVACPGGKLQPPWQVAPRPLTNEADHPLEPLWRHGLGLSSPGSFLCCTSGRCIWSGRRTLQRARAGIGQKVYSVRQAIRVFLHFVAVDMWSVDLVRRSVLSSLQIRFSVSLSFCEPLFVLALCWAFTKRAY